jgi:hypothetical protein
VGTASISIQTNKEYSLENITNNLNIAIAKIKETIVVLLNKKVISKVDFEKLLITINCK